ncbi:HEAT repeat domain-containing protein [Balneolales bacterium ANBcel1]|nr:HEAT repeat domain-containing protein [Balneolales bacterium ANBcel1]
MLIQYRLRSLSVLLLSLVFIIMSVGNVYAGPQITPPTTGHSAAFAIIVDSETGKVASDGIEAYRRALEQYDKLNVYTIIGDWERPDPLRDLIRSLAEENPSLEGFVLVGDLPIPMIRDAQHLTSSFKMDQERFDKSRSSIPSDRFYDDFDLEFSYIGPDDNHPLKHYYSLLPDAPQFLSMDLYSGRIKAPAEGAEGREMVNRYLLRVAKQKANPPILQHGLFTTGHGYHSESLASWEGEITSLREQFPQFFTPGGSLTNYYHFKGEDLKFELYRELQKPELNLAVFHAHGTPERQLLVGSPRHRTVQAQVDAIQLFLRNRLRRAERSGQPLEEVKAQYYEEFGIDARWFDGAFDEEVIRADSITSANQDMHVGDVERLSPAPQFIMFDQCFNGAFIQAPYVAGSYVFGNGQTVAALAHSVSVLQDIDANQFLGLLTDGMRAGRLVYFKNHLETHIIGDPTFRFAADTDRDINSILREKTKEPSFWEEMLNDPDPNYRALAIEMSARLKGASVADTLQRMYENDPAYIVRLQALKALARMHSLTDHIHHILPIAVHDPYEYIRRVSIGLMGDIGRSDYMDMIAEALINDHSRRVRFKARTAIQKVDAPRAADACRVVLDRHDENEEGKQMVAHTLNNFERTGRQLEEEMIPAIRDTSLAFNDRRRTIRMFRLYRYQQVVEPLLALVTREDDDVELRIIAAETLGWYLFSYQREEILEGLKNIRDDLAQAGWSHDESGSAMGSDLPQNASTGEGAQSAESNNHPDADRYRALSAEITRSINRLSQPPNHPFTL